MPIVSRIVHSKMLSILIFFLILLQFVDSFETGVRIFGGQRVPKKEEFESRWLVAFHNRLADHFFCAGSLVSTAHVLSGRQGRKYS